MAEYGIRKYRLGNALLRRSLIEGLTVEGDALQTVGVAYGVHSVLLPGLDSAQMDCQWGRVSLKCRLGAESMLTIRAFASNQDTIVRNNEVVRVDDFLLDPNVPRKEKERLFLLADGVERSGVQDVLLTGQTGRWLWLWLDVTGEGNNLLADMRVYVPGDHFFRTFPQVYQTDNDFFQRYLSVFSTLYQEFEEQIDALPALLDVDTAPPFLLPVFASWLGLETDDTLFTTEELRTLLKAAPELIARKGTKWAVERVVRLFVSDTVYIVERNLMEADYRNSKNLYGSSPYDFTVMVGCKMDEKLRLRLQFLIDQFKPIRCRYHIVFLEDCGGLDAFTYLDVNSALLQSAPGSLDDGKALTGMTYLE